MAKGTINASIAQSHPGARPDSGPVGPERLLIVNPNAGAAKNGFDPSAAAKLLQPCEVRLTHKAGQAGDLARDARRDGFTEIVVAGGDGTINEVVNGLAPHFGNVVIGVIPLGTGNDLARSLGIPVDAQQALEVVLRNSVRTIDVIHFRSSKGDQHFVNASAAGFSGAVSDNTDAERKARWGPFAYILSAAATLAELTKYRLSVTLDGRPFSIEAYSLVIANGQTVAGGISIAPNAQLDDGLLDVVIVPATSWTEAALAVPEILFGRHAESDRVVMTQARSLVVRSEPPLPMNLDGETMTEDEVRFELVPRALKVITGPRPPALAQQRGA